MSTARHRMLLEQLRSKGVKYWLEVAAVSGIGILASHFLNEHSPEWLSHSALRLYQVLSDLDPREPSPGDITVVLINDDEFWNQPFDRRLPLNRVHLAAAITKACSANPAVVALDFDLRSPLMDGKLNDNAVYADETKTLADTISKEASKACSIVLPATTYCPRDVKQPCRVDPTVFSDYKLNNPNIGWGYITLPSDLRHIPAQVHLGGQNRLDSFAQAIVRFKDRERIDRFQRANRFSYGTFVPPSVYREWGREMSYRDLMAAHDDDLKRRFKAAGIVLIGGSWRDRANGRGELVDQHYSPVGAISGIYLHANYIASILTDRTAHRLPAWVNIAFDGLVSIAIAIIFAIRFTALQRVSSIATMVVVMFAAQYLLWQNAGILFEVLIPVLALFLHWIYDEERQVRERLSGAESRLVIADKQLADARAIERDLRKQLAERQVPRNADGKVD